MKDISNSANNNKTQIKQTIKLLKTKKENLQNIETSYYGNEAAKIINDTIDKLTELLESGI